jgi:AsmA protein
MKKLLFALAILVGFLVLAGVAIVLLVDVNAHKPRIESTVSDALGMEFRIRGKARLRLFPSAGIALSDVRLRNRDTDLATAKTLRVGVKLLPLLNRQVSITELVLERPVIRIEKGADGTFNYEAPPGDAKPTAAPKEAEAPSAPLMVAKCSVSAGKIVYVDRKAGSETTLDAIDLSVRDLSIPTARGTELMKGISFTGDLSVKEMITKDLAVSGVRAKVTAGAGIYEIRPITMKLFGGAGEGGIRVDLSGDRVAMTAGIALSGARLRKRDTDLASAEKVRVGMKLLPPPNRQVEITELVLEKPVIRIEKGADGTFNYEAPAGDAKSTPKDADVPSSNLRVARSSVSSGKIVYVDRKAGSETTLDGIDLSVRDLSIPTANGTELPKGVSFIGDLSVREIRSKDLAVTDVRAKVTAGAGIYEIRPFTMKLFGGAGEGGIRVDLSGEKTALKVSFTLANFRAEEPLAALAQKKYLSGTMTVTPDLSLRGKGADEMRRTLSGSLSLRGDGLTLHGMEIDEILSKVDEAQKLNLADVGAFLLTGPLGSAALKGYRYGGLYRSATREGETRIVRLVSDWTVRDGVADARDVAFSTAKNRIALKGKLDLVNGRFVDVTVAALDKKGCATIRQKISGPFGDPRMDKTSVLQSFAEPILGLFEQARKLIGPASCEPFYTGTVPHP